MIYVETDCVFTHEGHSYASGGAVVTPDGALGYLAPNCRAMLTWRGDTLGTARIVSSWPTPRSYVSRRMYQIEATIDGVRYTGRGAGAGMIWRGRRMARQ